MTWYRNNMVPKYIFFDKKLNVTRQKNLYWIAIGFFYLQFTYLILCYYKNIILQTNPQTMGNIWPPGHRLSTSGIIYILKIKTYGIIFLSWKDDANDGSGRDILVQMNSKYCTYWITNISPSPASQRTLWTKKDL